jgi:hypothetical protein
MFEQLARWNLPLHGAPCGVCGRPASTLWVLANFRVVSHGTDNQATATCTLPNPRAHAQDTPAADESPQRNAA